MTRKEAKELLPVIQAFAEGKTIEVRVGNDSWVKTDEVYGGRNNDYDYRIKPEPKYRPFKDAEECWAEMQKHQPFGWLYNKPNNQYYYITTLDNYGIVTTPFDEVYYEKYTDFIKRKTTFADGTPFGIKE
jgi:hypothetical protein